MQADSGDLTKITVIHDKSCNGLRCWGFTYYVLCADHLYRLYIHSSTSLLPKLFQKILSLQANERPPHTTLPLSSRTSHFATMLPPSYHFQASDNASIRSLPPSYHSQASDNTSIRSLPTYSQIGASPPSYHPLPPQAPPLPAIPPQFNPPPFGVHPISLP
jgi:hypothetical protein